MSAATRLYLAELRAGRPVAVRRLRAALVDSGGNVGRAAAALGVSPASVYRAAEASESVRRCVAKHGMGRVGAAGKALESRGISRDPEKST